MYQLTEVKTKKDKKEFLRLPVALYKNEKHWIRPLDKDIEEIFDPAKNKYFQNGVCIRWILTDNRAQTVGRVASFIDFASSGKNDQPTGGVGFFECINDVNAAFILFDACTEWLKQHGMEAMDGPVNFGDRDKWWGLLTDGFYEPNYCMPYNFAYYKEFFENYGFQNYFNQYTYHRKVSTSNLAPEVLLKAKRFEQNPHLRIEHIDKQQGKKFANDFAAIYNKAWATFSGTKPISPTHANALFKSIRPIMDQRLMWFAYYDNEPAGFFIMIPEINQIVKHLNGRFNLLSKLKFAWLLRRKTCTKILGLIFGVIPQYQGKGLEAAMVMAFAGEAWKPGFPYKDIELNWIGDFNPAMMRVAEKIGASILKTHVTYRFLFDRTKEFKRAPLVNVTKGNRP
jgi:GNAT superfamily N-acetyltransferase